MFKFGERGVYMLVEAKREGAYSKCTEFNAFKVSRWVIDNNDREKQESKFQHDKDLLAF